MSIEVPSEKTSNIDNSNNNYPVSETRLIAQDMLWNMNNSTGYKSGESTRYGDKAPNRSLKSSFAGFHKLNRINPKYGTAQSPSQEDFLPSFPEV